MQKTSLVTVAAAQYPVEFLGRWEKFEHKITTMVSEAVAENAQLLLFPEYGCMELASLFSPTIYQSLSGQLDAMQSLLPGYQALHRNLAQEFDVTIIAASFPVQLPDGSYRNRAYVCTPDGAIDFQDKLIMTRFENESWHISPGETIKIFQTPHCTFGISICYDSEFPLIARRQVEMGANVILAPSCTDTVAGYNRVRIGCQARALENQCYVVMAPVVGVADWSEAIDVNMGAASIFTPVDYGFPSDGILAQGEMNQPQWLFAELDLAYIDSVRHDGQVVNYRDWNHQWPVYARSSAVAGWLAPVLVNALTNQPAEAQANHYFSLAQPTLERVAKS
ncbi:MAG: carbon-nitrogen hydrolase family protein [Caldilineaceae bacterium]